MQEKRGLFIVFDGIDGGGKSTALWNFSKYLFNRDKNMHILITREPYKKREIREILRQDLNPYSQKEKLTELYVEDRREHIAEIISPSLEVGVNVISDRYKYATLAYQSSQGMPINQLIEMHKKFLVPDIVFIIDVSVDTAIKRMRKAIKKEGRQAEHKFEADREFLEKVRKNFLMLPQLLPEESIIIIDGNKSVEDVNKEINKRFEEFLKAKENSF